MGSKGKSWTEQYVVAFLQLLQSIVIDRQYVHNIMLCNQLYIIHTNNFKQKYTYSFISCPSVYLPGGLQNFYLHYLFPLPQKTKRLRSRKTDPTKDYLEFCQFYEGDHYDGILHTNEWNNYKTNIERKYYNNYRFSNLNFQSCDIRNQDICIC